MLIIIKVDRLLSWNVSRRLNTVHQTSDIQKIRKDCEERLERGEAKSERIEFVGSMDDSMAWLLVRKRRTAQHGDCKDQQVLVVIVYGVVFTNT